MRTMLGPRRLRAPFLLGLVVGLLVLAGAASYAFWTVRADVGARATTASVGFETSGGAGLDVTYGANTTAAGTAVTLRNTGSREGTYMLSITPGTAAMGGAVAVRVGTVATTGHCTADASLGAPVAGTLGSALSHSGRLAAGSSVILCVRTSMAAADVSAHGGDSVAASIATALAVGEWTRAGGDVGFTQSVDLPAPVAAAATKPGWYLLQGAAEPTLCLATVDYHGPAVQQKACQNAGLATPDDQLWRFADAGDGNSQVVVRAGSKPWLQAASAQLGTPTAVGTSGSDLGRWRVVAAGGGVRLTLRADPTLCLAAQGAGAGARMGLAACDPASSKQAFTLIERGDSAPQPVTLACRTDGYTAYLEWPKLAGYEGDVAYRVRVDGSESTIHARATGWDTTAQFAGDRFAATYPAGPHTITVEQSVFGGPWTTTGTGTITSAATAPYLACGSR